MVFIWGKPVKKDASASKSKDRLVERFLDVSEDPGYINEKGQYVLPSKYDDDDYECFFRQP